MVHGIEFPLGNAAKVYCLKQLEPLAATGRPITLLDMGCGTAKNFTAFLDRHPNVRYVGIDPHGPSIKEARRVLANRNAELHHGRAEAFALQDGADAIVSFSVFEHVVNRHAYLAAVRRNLKPSGVAFINYDAGHFTTESTTSQHQTAMRAARQAVAQFFRNFLAERLGRDVYYQRFVTETSFIQDCALAGLRITESLSFNTALKLAFRHVKESARAEYMQRWFDLELWLNANAYPYQDSMAPIFTTRCHTLVTA